MKKQLLITVIYLFFTTLINAQWPLKLTSNVYLRTWKLDTKASKEEKEIDGATITLYQNGKQINQTTSSNGGEFTLLIPQDGEFYLLVSYPGCNSKRMSINTQNVPEKYSKDNFKPTFKITGGFIMVKPYPGINYSELNQDLTRVEFIPNKKAFDDTEEGTERGLGIVSKIYDAEDALFSRFCSTNKAGDIALAKPDCPLAKSLYEKAISMIPGEQYPVDQLAKVGLCLKDKELAEKKAAEEAAAKAAADIAAKEKASATKEAENKKAVEDALAKAAEKNAAAVKEEEAKLAKAQNEKAAKEQEKNNKAKNQKTLEEKLAAENLAKQKIRDEQKEKEKKGGLKIKQKTPEEIEAEAILAKQREGMAKSQAEDKEAMQADADKAKAKREEKQKAAREKEKKQKEGMAKSQAEDEAAIKADNEKRKKAAADREAEEEAKRKKAFETKAKDGEGEMDKGNSDHSIPQVLGSSLQKYKEKIKSADDLFKMKRYAEAKTAYEEALKYKANDPYATNKLADIAKLTAPK